jgi:uncharacterized protein YhfF
MAYPTIKGMRIVELGDPGEMRTRLLNHVLEGNKRATAGTLQFDYEAEGEPVEVVGEKMALVGNLGEHVATIQITRVDIARFAEVTDEFALAEDEGDLTGDDFRKSHFKYWTSCGYEINDDTMVVCAYFDLIEDLR